MGTKINKKNTNGYVTKLMVKRKKIIKITFHIYCRFLASNANNFKINKSASVVLTFLKCEDHLNFGIYSEFRKYKLQLRLFKLSIQLNIFSNRWKCIWKVTEWTKVPNNICLIDLEIVCCDKCTWIPEKPLPEKKRKMRINKNVNISVASMIVEDVLQSIKFIYWSVIPRIEFPFIASESI